MSRFEVAVDIEIDRLVLRGLALTPERAERIRTAVERELQRLLQQEGIVAEIKAQQVPQLEGPGVQISTLDDDERLALDLAQSLARSLREMG